jgi:SAM-dependent methyltransferase
MTASLASDAAPYTTGHATQSACDLLRPGGLGLTALAIELARLHAGASVLDLGCGRGESVAYLRTLGFAALGVDRRQPLESGSYDAFQIVAAAEELPLPNACMDGILAECSLSLVADLDRTLSECARVLKIGGRLMVSDVYAREPQHIFALRTVPDGCASSIFVQEELEERLALHGFEVETWQDHSRALRESAARYIFEHGSLNGMWSSRSGSDACEIQGALRDAHAGYFLLIARRISCPPAERGFSR